jgi:hypothetical protein
MEQRRSPSATPKSAESRTPDTLAVAGGVSATAGLVYFVFLFGAAADTNFFPHVYRWGGGYLVLTVVLYLFRFNRLALLVAWLPVLLLFVLIPALGDFANLFGAK